MGDTRLQPHDCKDCLRKQGWLFYHLSFHHQRFVAIGLTKRLISKYDVEGLVSEELLDDTCFL